MEKKTLLLFIELAFLLIALFVGTPFEFLNETIDTIATFVIIILFILLFFLLFRQISRVENKKLKWLTLGFSILIAIPYLFIGLWTILLTWSNYHPMWQDLKVYTNERNEKVISQWRETSGSIYDYRDRKIIAEYSQFRISFNCNTKNLTGIWTEHDIEKNTKAKINFNNRK
jgi:predicted membrane protein